MPEQVLYLDNVGGVFGDPVAENPTVVMHEAAFAHLGIRWRYLTLNIKAENLTAAVAGMRAMQFQGINLTNLHKVAVLQYLDQLAEDAAIMAEVNTVRREGGKLVGENSDGKGFMLALREDAGVDPRQTDCPPGGRSCEDNGREPFRGTGARAAAASDGADRRALQLRALDG